VDDLEDGPSSFEATIDPDLDEHGLGTVTVTCAHTDTGGLSDDATATYTVDDTTDPWISGSIPAPGWHKGDVVITWTCGDSGSGVATCPPPTTITGEGTGLSAMGTVVDHAGNSTSVTVDGVDIDRTLPVITWSGPTSYTVGETLAVGCTVDDALSGLASSTCPTATGTASTAGSFTLTATATDNAGNTSTSMRTYTVAPAVTFDSLIALTSELAGKGGKGMVAILKAAKKSAEKGNVRAANSQLDDYVAEVNAQTGRSLTTAEAQQLLDLTSALRQSL
jgi:hypothetical protein